MRPRQSIILSVFILALAAILFPTASFAIQDRATAVPRPSFLVEITVKVTTTLPSGRVIQGFRHGAGALIAQDLVVTAAHIIDENSSVNGESHEITGITINGFNRNEEGFLANVEMGRFFATDDLRPDGAVAPLGGDIAVLQLANGGVENVEVLRLAREVGVNVAEQRELVGTLFGVRTPDRRVIERAYDRLFNADGAELTETGRREFEQRPDGARRRTAMPNDIVLHGTTISRDPGGSPFVGMRIPQTPATVGDPNLFAGLFTELRPSLNFAVRSTFLNNAHEAAQRLPFHIGDSGAPFVSVAPNGEFYLAGVASRIRHSRNNDIFTYTPMIATEDPTDLIREFFGRADLNPSRDSGRGVVFWDPVTSNVATLEIWDSFGGVDLARLPDDWRTTSALSGVCESNDAVESQFCADLQSPPSSDYSVRPVSIVVNAPNREVLTTQYSPSSPASTSREYRIHGQITYFSPEDNFQNVTSNPPRYEDSNGLVINIPQSAPRRLTIGSNGDDSTSESDLYFPTSFSDVTISANATEPTFCIGTPSGVHANTATTTEILIPENRRSCISINETNRAPNDQYDLTLDGYNQGETLMVTLAIVDLTSSTSDQDIVIALLNRIWGVPLRLI
ncbi:trypsin-like serine protease [Alcanivoracaceae bacterium MT1]